LKFGLQHCVALLALLLGGFSGGLFAPRRAPPLLAFLPQASRGGGLLRAPLLLVPEFPRQLHHPRLRRGRLGSELVQVSSRVMQLPDLRVQGGELGVLLAAVVEDLVQLVRQALLLPQQQQPLFFDVRQALLELRYQRREGPVLLLVAVVAVAALERAQLGFPQHLVFVGQAPQLGFQGVAAPHQGAVRGLQLPHARFVNRNERRYYGRVNLCRPAGATKKSRARIYESRRLPMSLRTLNNYLAFYDGFTC
jgi:hypothetical protein